MPAGGGKRVLDVGQCQADHGAIRALVESTFGATVEYSATVQNALERLCEETYTLVLVNRVIDADATEGLSLIHRMKASDFLRDVPVIMISNFASAQKEAVSAGAAPGFGKGDLDSDETRGLLAAYLGEPQPG